MSQSTSNASSFISGLNELADTQRALVNFRSLFAPEPQQAAVQPQLQQQQPMQARQPKRGPSAMHPCANCGDTDHWAKECPMPAKRKKPEDKNDNAAMLQMLQEQTSLLRTMFNPAAPPVAVPPAPSTIELEVKPEFPPPSSIYPMPRPPPSAAAAAAAAADAAAYASVSSDVEALAKGLAQRERAQKNTNTMINSLKLQVEETSSALATFAAHGLHL